MLDEALQVCKRLWSEPAVSHEGEFYRFDRVAFEPKPLQQPHPPIHVGGDSEAALQRVARAADGWFGIGYTHESIVPVLQRLQVALSAQGRDA